MNGSPVSFEDCATIIPQFLDYAVDLICLSEMDKRATAPLSRKIKKELGFQDWQNTRKQDWPQNWISKFAVFGRNSVAHLRAQDALW